jgi:hypothetical protein
MLKYLVGAHSLKADEIIGKPVEAGTAPATVAEFYIGIFARVGSDAVFLSSGGTTPKPGSQP